MYWITSTALYLFIPHTDAILVHNWLHNTFGERDYPLGTASLLALAEFVQRTA